ncbi:Ig-like domain-containing protein, partial [Rubripirellula amarantea]|nr:Ig-like domain-containing protein [Rubripirellula amarantea]
ARSTGTVTGNVTAVNDAPVLDNSGDLTLTTITEDDVDNGGLTVAQILASDGGSPISDVDSGSVDGIAITARNNGPGIWQYSTDGGTNWSNVGTVSDSSALLLRSTDLVRFEPNGENGTTKDFTFRAWDGTSGTAGNKVDASTNGGTTAFSTDTETASIVVTSVNDAPTINDGSVFNFAGTNEDTNSSSSTAADILASSSLNDVDFSSQSGLAITSLTGNGTWQYSTDGLTWTSFGAVSASNALLLSSTTQIRFAPDTENGETATFSYRAWDQSSGTASTNGSTSHGDTSTNGGVTAYSSQTASAQITVTDVNDAPFYNTAGDTEFTTITEDDLNNAGETVADLIASAGGNRITDVDDGAVEGIAIRSAQAGNGTWQYSLNGGTSWLDVGTVTNSSALLLRDTDMLRFQPNGETGTTAHLSVRAWDQTTGTAGTKVNTSVGGGSSAFGTTPETMYITVTDVNDAPEVTSPTTATVVESGSLIFNSGGAGLIDTTDVDGDTLTVTLTANHASLVLAQTTNLVMLDADGTDGTLQFSGSVADIDAALNGLTYSSQAGYNGSATLAVLVDDGSLTDSTTVAITVNPGQTTFTWDGGGASNDWSDADNWDHDLVPEADDIVVFDITSTKASTVDASFVGAIAQITVTADYTNTITQARDLNVTGNMNFQGTTWNAFGATLDVDGDFTVTDLRSGGGDLFFGGNYTHTGGANNFSGTWTFDSTDAQTIDVARTIGSVDFASDSTITLASDLSVSGDLTHSSGSVDFAGHEVIISGTGNQAIDASGLTFDDFRFDNASGTITITGGLDVDGDLTYTNAATINGAGIFASGNVVTTDAAISGTSLLTLDGTTDQQISTGGGTGELGNLAINKASGTVELLNDIELGGNFTHTSGGFDAGGNTVEFQGHNTTITAGTATFDNVILNSTVSGTRNIVGTLDVDGDFTLLSAGSLNGGQITVAGNMTFTDTLYSGATMIVANGTGNQSISAGAAGAKVEHLTINKASGTLTFGTDLIIAGSLTHTAGNVADVTHTITFGNNSGTINASGINFGDVVFDSNYNKNIVGVLNVDGNLTITSVIAINNGELRVAGNVTSTDTTVGGDATLTLVGTGDQTISGDDLAGGDITIDKASGTVILADALVLDGTNQDLNVIAGSLDMNGQTITTTGDVVVDNATLIGSGTVTNDLTIQNNGLVQLAASSTSVYETISVGGNLTISADSDLQLDVSGMSVGGYLNDIFTSGGLSGTWDTITLINDGVGFTVHDEYNNPSGSVDLFLNSNPTGTISDVTVDEDAPDTVIDLDAAFSDLEHADNELTYSLVGYAGPAFLDSATIDNAAGTLTLDYAANQSGNVEITVRATDARGQYTDVSFNVTVNAVNDAPVASDGTDNATEDGSQISGTLVVTDNDPGDTHTFTLVSGTSEGTAVVNSNGSYTFDPGADFQDLAVGETRDVTFVYRVTDDGVGNLNDEATVTITVTGTNDA